MSIIQEPQLIVVRKFDNRYKPGCFKIATPLIFSWPAKRCVIRIDAGIYTDFASIPVGLRNMFSVNGDHRLPAIIHDYLYERRGAVLAESLIDDAGNIIPQESPVIVRYTRAESDVFFYQSMMDEGVSSFISGAMYHAVRLFGFNYEKGWVKT